MKYYPHIYTHILSDNLRKLDYLYGTTYHLCEVIHVKVKQSIIIF